MGSPERVKFIHWFSRPFDDKFPEIQVAYNAGDKAFDMGLSLTQTFNLIKAHPKLAEENQNFREIKMFMDVMELYRVTEVPTKPKCW